MPLALSLQTHLHHLLPNHLIRSLVLPNTKKDRLAETIIPRPLRILYLADHHRFDPTATLHFGSGQPLVPPTSANRRKVIKRHFSTRILFNSEKRVLRSFSVKPVPTLPVNSRTVSGDRAKLQKRMLVVWPRRDVLCQLNEWETPFSLNAATVSRANSRRTCLRFLMLFRSAFWGTSSATFWCLWNCWLQ